MNPWSKKGPTADLYWEREYLAEKALRLRMQAALGWAKDHLAHENHGTDLCFACYLESEIGALIDGDDHAS